MAHPIPDLLGASWIPGPPSLGEKLRQLRVYLGAPWEDVTEGVDWDKDRYDDVIETLRTEIEVKYPIVRRRIELFALSDQQSSEGPWQYFRRVVSACKLGAIGDRTSGLQMSYDDFVTTLYLKGLRESDRQNVHTRFMS